METSEVDLNTVSSLDRLEGLGIGVLGPVIPRWNVFAWSEAEKLIGVKSMHWLVPGKSLYRIDQGEHLDGWWVMLDFIRIWNGGTVDAWDLRDGWGVIDHRTLQIAKASFRMMGLDHRLDLCENPDLFPENHSRMELTNIDGSVEYASMVVSKLSEAKF